MSSKICILYTRIKNEADTLAGQVAGKLAEDVRECKVAKVTITLR